VGLRPGASLPALFSASAGSIQLTVATIVDVINIAVKNIIESIVLVIPFPVPGKILKTDHRFHCVLPFGIFNFPQLHNYFPQANNTLET